jgi:hypothetical protein
VVEEFDGFGDGVLEVVIQVDDEVALGAAIAFEDSGVFAVVTGEFDQSDGGGEVLESSDGAGDSLVRAAVVDKDEFPGVGDFGEAEGLEERQEGVAGIVEGHDEGQDRVNLGGWHGLGFLGEGWFGSDDEEGRSEGEVPVAAESGDQVGEVSEEAVEFWGQGAEV